jgi:tRNA A-37 threonylcarbamoyl transferase component Bud32
MTVRSPIAEAPGTVIGPYKLLELIGEGGMGIVYLAEQEGAVRRKVALKVIKPGMDTRQVIARFEAERQAMALMDHPNIAKVLDAGASDGGRPYFVMELVRGVPITEYCDRERLPISERLALFVPVCHAVQHAHQKGVIHRDLKPSNILITLHDGVPVPKVIDFGIAKATRGKLTEKTLETGLTQLIGSPLYMSPEQAGLSGLDIDWRSDIYSLGVLLYELLTGTTPFNQEVLRTVAFDEVRQMIGRDEPPRPSMRLGDLGAVLTEVAARRGSDPRRLRGLMRGGLDWIVMKALEKDRNRRYQTASSLARDLQRCLRNEPLEAGPPGLAYRLRKLARRYQAVLGTTSAFGVLLVTAAVLYAASGARVTAAQRRAEQAAQEAAIARAVSEFLQQDVLSQSRFLVRPTPTGQRRADLTVRSALDRAAATVESRFQGQPLVEAAICLSIGSTYQALGECAAAQPHLERARTLRLRALGATHPDTLAAAHALASLHQAPADLAEAKTRIVELEQDWGKSKKAAQWPDRLGPNRPG